MRFDKRKGIKEKKQEEDQVSLYSLLVVRQNNYWDEQIQCELYFRFNKSITIVQIVHNKNAVWSFVRFYKFGKKSYLLPNLYLVTYS